MSDLLKTISRDLSIEPYYGESSFDYCYRVCYSALALSLLYSSRSVEAGRIGISKKAQTDLLSRMLNEYEQYLSLDSRRLIRDSHIFINHFRRVYEETGYLVQDDRGFEVIASFGRTVPIDCRHLFFGIPDDICFMRGLGVFTNTPENEDNLFDVFLRDTLSPDEYILCTYNPLDFEYRDIDPSTLEFLNPLLRKPPSSSWRPEIHTRRTVAKSKESNTMYRVICEDDGKLLFADISTLAEKDSLTSYETRRLYIALKEHYGEPAVAWFNQIDDSYYEINLSAHLPTREYYFLLLCSWPKKHAFNRTEFVTTAEILPTVEMMLHNIGVKIIWRSNYV